jgi:hypothetical protein
MNLNNLKKIPHKSKFNKEYHVKFLKSFYCEFQIILIIKIINKNTFN